MRDHKIDKLKKALLQRDDTEEDAKLWLSTGVTPLDTALTGHRGKGFLAGHYYFYAGDSDSGKSVLAHLLLAEAAHNPKFDDYELVLDDVEEAGSELPLERFYGRKLVDRLRAPAYDDAGNKLHSRVVEDLYFYLDDFYKERKKVVYVVDSMDALSCLKAEQLYSKQKAEYRKNKEVSDSYNTIKAQINARNLPRIVRKQLPETGSILVIIGQLRADFGGFGKKPGQKKWSGGDALKYYASVMLWTGTKSALYKSYLDKSREIGILVRINIKKNRLTGRKRSVEVPIYHSYGVDDIGACVDFLITERFWTSGKGGIKAGELNFVGSRDKLIRHVEQNNLQGKLKALVAKHWRMIEKACSLDRKPRYE